MHGPNARLPRGIIDLHVPLPHTVKDRVCFKYKRLPVFRRSETRPFTDVFVQETRECERIVLLIAAFVLLIVLAV